ncbi:hypothetical protein NL676_033620 [Syzygium grande]|nr:hypothetical protein NL676_033620 [Syzygium grande]
MQGDLRKDKALPRRRRRLHDGRRRNEERVEGTVAVAVRLCLFLLFVAAVASCDREKDLSPYTSDRRDRRSSSSLNRDTKFVLGSWGGDVDVYGHVCRLRRLWGAWG